MNYDLAIMALEGLSRTPLTVTSEAAVTTISGEPAAFRELARLCLLLGGASDTEDAFELQPHVHVNGGAITLRLV
jgi:hypothetical protein